MEMIVMLVNYLNQNNDDKIVLLDFDESRTKIVITKLIMWVKAEYKRYIWTREGKKNLHKPLLLNYQYHWCNDIKILVEKDSRFSKLFYVKDSELDFNDKLSDEEKNKILLYVGENLNSYFVI